MSRFPPPPGQGFAPPPPGQGFAPPPPGGQFPPPPGQPAPANRGFPPPPPAGNGFQPPPPQPGGGFQPPPPPNQAMANMSLGGGPPPPPQQGSFAPPPPPGAQRGPPAPGGMLMGIKPPPGAPAMFGAAPAPPPPPGVPQSQFYGGGPAAPPQPQPGAGPPQGGQAMFQENIDFSIQIPDRLCRFTCKAVPSSPQLMTQTKIPLGGMVRPMATAPSEEEEVAVVQPNTAVGIVRCKKCRTYINAFVTWVENGRRWRCNICAQINDCHSQYFCHLDENGNRRDRDQRPELSQGVVEFIAPAEYMVRPPQEPTYFFVIDVSATAVRCGMLHSIASSIRKSLDNLPGRGRTKVGFITYDNSVHYYNLAPTLQTPQMMVVSDLKELFVPLPDHLLVNLQESRHVVDTFLDNLPEMFAKDPVVSMSCLGSALKAAFTVMKQVGGKMCVFQSIMPNLGDGALRPRENQALMGTPNEMKLLRPDTPWYKDTAVEFSRQQISVDMFLFPYQYMDVSALSELPRYTAGTLFSYVGFHPERDGPRFESELEKRLTQNTAFEAVMRIRCTKGMRITNFYGNFFIRGTDLLALPNCTSDSVFGFDLAHDESTLSSMVVTVQAALLYTSSEGQRRIRVMTQALPITNSTAEIVSSIDTETACTLMSKRALDMSVKTSIDNSRMRIQQMCIEMIRAGKGGRTVSGYSVPPHGAPGAPDNGDSGPPENLELLPLYTLALMKNVAFRGGTDVHPDERIFAQYVLNSMWVTQCRDFIYPKMFSIHDMSPSVGLPTDATPDGDTVQVAGRERILMPQAVNLSCERLMQEGIFLLDNGMQMSLWIGSNADPNLLTSLFGTPSLDNVDMNQVSVNLTGDDFANRFGSIAFALREEEGEPLVICPKIDIVREGDPHMEARFFWNLIEDGASFQGGTYSYAEFMDFVNNPQAGAAPPAPGMQRGPPSGMPGGGRGGPPPPPGGGRGPPPPGQPNYGGPPPAGGGYGGGPPPPGPPGAPNGAYGGPPQAGPPGSYGGPPPPGPPGPPGSYGGAPRGPPSYGGPPSGGPPSGPPPPSAGPPRAAPPATNVGPPPPGPPQGGYGAPPPPQQQQPQYGAPPPQQPQYGAPPPQQIPAAQGPPPPPPGPSMAPPPGGMPPRSAPPAYGAPPPPQQQQQQPYGAPPPQQAPPPPGRGMPPPPPMGGARPPPPPPR